MNAFEGYVRPLYERMVMSMRESRALAKLRDALLPKLIRGEIRLHNPARLVSDTEPLTR